jgi:hypothetical protein
MVTISGFHTPPSYGYNIKWQQRKIASLLSLLSGMITMSNNSALLGCYHLSLQISFYTSTLFEADQVKPPA